MPSAGRGAGKEPKKEGWSRKGRPVCFPRTYKHCKGFVKSPGWLVPNNQSIFREARLLKNPLVIGAIALVVVIVLIVPRLLTAGSQQGWVYDGNLERIR